MKNIENCKFGQSFDFAVFIVFEGGKERKLKMDELALLQAEFEQVQLVTIRNLSERSCVEIIIKLIEAKKVSFQANVALSRRIWLRLLFRSI